MSQTILDYGPHTPFVLISYTVSIIVIAALIVLRRRKLKKALEAERADSDGNA